MSGLGNGGPDDNDAQAGRLVVGALTSRYGKGADSDATDAMVTHALTAEGHDASEDGTGRGTPIIAFHPTGGGEKGLTPMDDCSPSLDHNGTAVVMRMREGKDGGGKGPLMSEESSLTLAKANDQTLFIDAWACRGSSSPNQHPVSDDGLSDALDTTAPGGVFAGTAVRRLTTVECCRLQGFPDDWFGEPNEVPDGPRYAGLGDAVTVNVAEWIGRRLVEVQ